LERTYLVPLKSNAYVLGFPDEFPPHQTITFEVTLDVPNCQPAEGQQTFVWMDPNYPALIEDLPTIEPSFSETFDPEQFLEGFSQLSPESQDHWTFGLSLMEKYQILSQLVIFFLSSCHLPLVEYQYHYGQ